MINNEIIKIASNTTNVGLTNNYTYKCSLKNIMCGDKIKIELISKKSKINSMKYETESCIYCEASASLLSNKIKNLTLKNLTIRKFWCSTLQKVALRQPGCCMR